jgi:hypothetical protein
VGRTPRRNVRGGVGEAFLVALAAHHYRPDVDPKRLFAKRIISGFFAGGSAGTIAAGRRLFQALFQRPETIEILQQIADLANGLERLLVANAVHGNHCHGFPHKHPSDP